MTVSDLLTRLDSDINFQVTLYNILKNSPGDLLPYLIGAGYEIVETDLANIKQTYYQTSIWAYIGMYECDFSYQSGDSTLLSPYDRSLYGDSSRNFCYLQIAPPTNGSSECHYLRLNKQIITNGIVPSLENCSTQITAENFNGYGTSDDNLNITFSNTNNVLAFSGTYQAFGNDLNNPTVFNVTGKLFSQTDPSDPDIKAWYIKVADTLNNAAAKTPGTIYAVTGLMGLVNTFKQQYTNVLTKITDAAGQGKFNGPIPSVNQIANLVRRFNEGIYSTNEPAPAETSTATNPNFLSDLDELGYSQGEAKGLSEAADGLTAEGLGTAGTITRVAAGIDTVFTDFEELGEDGI